MISCPVCEHPQQAGFECEVCGKELLSLGPVPVAPTERLEGLEATVGESVGPVRVERVAELEVTHFAPAELAVMPAPDVEHTSAPAAGAVPVERMADLDEDRAPQIGGRTVLSTGPQTCRYCQNVQAEGVLCERCGMRLPRAPVRAAAPTRRGVEEVRVRCKVCGAPALTGKRCRECGNVVEAPAES